jgi:putative ABC transport system permease protein
MMGSFLRDLRCGVRVVLKRPGLSLAVVATFGLGIGLTTTVFSIVNGALFRGLPFPDAEAIVLVGRTNPARGFDFMGVEVHDYLDFRDQQTAFSGFGALSMGPVNFAEGNGPPERLTGGFFTCGVFDMLRVRPLVGRLFLEEECRPDADPVILIGYDLWQQRFEGSPDVLGRSVLAHGESRTIVGVMPEGFMFPDREQVWLPLVLDPGATLRGQGPAYMVVARLADGVTPRDAQARLAAVSSRLEEAYPETDGGLGVTVQTFTERLAGGGIVSLLLAMLGGVLGVLLIACANVANLLLARAAGRAREVAVRRALGAGRAAVVRQLMVEVLLLALLGGTLGFGLGLLGLRWFNLVIRVDPPPYWIRFDLDHRVFLFVLGATVFASVASSLLPALQTTRTDVVGTLKDESRSGSGLRLGRFTAGLVVAEVAISCALLIASGLMVRSVVQLRTVPMPFTTHNILTAAINLPTAEYPDTVSRVGFYDQLLPRVAAIPGVEAATLSDGLPAAGNGARVFEVEGATYASDDDYPTAREGIVTDGYFETFQVRVLRGRAFVRSDRRESQPVAVVNESFAHRFLSDGDPVGRRIRMGVRDTTAHWLTVVGVVPDLYMQGIGNNNASPAGFYIPISQSGVGGYVNVALRTRETPTRYIDAVRTAVAAIDPKLPVFRASTMEEVIVRQTFFYRLFGTLFMVLGFAALFLAAVGLYGVMSFSVSRRSHEMGVRMAMGAEGRQLVRLVLRRGVVHLGVGLAIGLTLAGLATKPLQVVLYDVDARDPLVFGVVVAALALVGIAASLVPAWRVTRVDPVVALTAE